LAGWGHLRFLLLPSIEMGFMPTKYFWPTGAAFPAGFVYACATIWLLVAGSCMSSSVAAVLQDPPISGQAEGAATAPTQGTTTDPESAGQNPTIDMRGRRTQDTNANRSQSDNRPTQFWPPGVAWNEEIPTPRDFFGFDLGTRHLRHDQVVAYLQSLANASERIHIRKYGESHDRRPLLILTITSPENHSRLKQIQSKHRQLANPAESSKVTIDSLPAVINMGYGVHGDEPSATHCAVLVAYYLAAAQGTQIDSVLSSNIILLDPVLNPDGFDRFTNWANMYRGKIDNADPGHAEHQQGWHRGRTNYYWFDLNRDWMPLVHPESQARMQWYHSWKPNVVLDFHEMGTNSTYFFQPGIPGRSHPLTPPRNIELTTAIADYHARSFDATKTMYFSQEAFDDFYVGKGSTYPDLHGAVGILFEQASSRGHVQESDNGLLRFPTTISNQFTTSLSSLAAATDKRLELLEYKRWFYQSAIEESTSDPASVQMFVAPGNAHRLRALATLFHAHDIACFQLREDLQLGEQHFDRRYTLVVPTEQPEYRFLKSILERRTEFAENAFYDISAWTIPLAYHVQQIELARPIAESKLEPFSRQSATNPSSEWSDDDVGYLIGWRDDAAPRWLAEALAANLLVKVASRPVTLTSRDQTYELGCGTLMIPMGVSANRPQAVKRLVELGQRLGLEIIPVSSGLTSGVGVDLGSNHFRTIEKPELAMLVEGNVSAAEAGEAWHALDTRLKMPITLLKNAGAGSLDRYNKLILVSGRYDSSEVIEAWVRNGGTLIAVGSATQWVASWTKQTPAKNDGAPAASAPAENKTEEPPLQQPFMDARDELALKSISGAIFRAQIDRTHPLGYGFTDETLAVFRNHTRKMKRSPSPYGNPLVYAAENPLIAGYASAENQQQLAGQPGIVVQTHGRGRVILMNDNPNFRGFWLGTQRIFFNALFFGQLADPPTEATGDGQLVDDDLN
jgi:hypothetical protein